MYYFRFEIPLELRGDITKGKLPGYSPDWHGTMPKCPKNVEVLLYNDRDGYGIAKTDDKFIPPEVEALKEDNAVKLLLRMEQDPDADNIFMGEKLAHRWDDKPVEEPVENQPDPEPKVATTSEKQVLDSYVKFCPVCHQIVARLVKFADGTLEVWQNGRAVLSGVKAATLILGCPAGHKVKVVSDGK